MSTSRGPIRTTATANAIGDARRVCDLYRHALVTPTRRSAQTIRRDVYWGWRRAVPLAVFAGAFAAFQGARQGSSLFADLGVTFGQVILLYLGAAFAGGLVLGLMRPHRRVRSGARSSDFCLRSSCTSGAW